MDKSAHVVTADWLEKSLGSPDLRIVDASWYLPAQKRNGAAEYAEGHIPGAVFFDQDVVADHVTNLPHTIPAPDVFAAEVSKLGISDRDTIVVYDGPGIVSSARVWWLFRVMGATRVFVLDGGLDGWKREGRPLQKDLPEPAPARFTPHFNAARLTTLEAMKSIVASRSAQIADARPKGRFTAEDPEPRPGLRGGHMPGARSVPAVSLIRDGKLKTPAELKALFSEAGIDLSRPVVTSCGSGVTAAVITLALETVGHHDNTLYDGSWSEWGSRDDTPIVTGQD